MREFHFVLGRETLSLSRDATFNGTSEANPCWRGFLPLPQRKSWHFCAAVNLMFPNHTSLVSDFENQLGAFVSAMSQEDTIGQMQVFTRQRHPHASYRQCRP
ncbi:hypothetical protein DES41_108123 [Pseudorhodoferax soli]|uniref:Uncharacterized protein n=1 Tax=Pseudorhodoferax soli TaxID=545864 RepID=A0A368XL64_9BURK|nr:hypothetical protein DES41_108123 [Pseudorhodoferax soli]